MTSPDDRADPEGRGQASKSASSLVSHAYRELKELARSFLARERSNHTLVPTALVHEAWLRLAGQDRVSWDSRDHFLAVAAIAMRRVLVDHARAKKSDKRGGNLALEPLATSISSALRDEGLSVRSHIDLLTLDEGLQQLAKRSERASRIVELRFFGGLTEEEISRVLGVARSTVTLEWKASRAWLSSWMTKGQP